MSKHWTLRLPAAIAAAGLLACLAALLAVPGEAAAASTGENGRIAYEVPGSAIYAVKYQVTDSSSGAASPSWGRRP